MLATATVFGLLLTGTIWGDDDHFPFGPFRMYATNAGPNAPADDLRVEAVDRHGRVIVLNERNSGVRRAEVEGQRGEYTSDPRRLRRLAEAYARANPGAPEVVEVRIIIRWHQIERSRPTGSYTEETIVSWRAS